MHIRALWCVDMETYVATDVIKFINVEDPADVVFWNFRTGVFMWIRKHRDKLSRYEGHNGEKVEIEWNDGKPTPYWGWW